MLQCRCALKALKSRLEILNEEFLQEGCCLSEIVNFLRTARISQAKVVYYMRKEAISYGKDF